MNVIKLTLRQQIQSSITDRWESARDIQVRTNGTYHGISNALNDMATEGIILRKYGNRPNDVSKYRTLE